MLPSLGCVTGLEPAKRDAKWQDRPSRFCYVLAGRCRFIATNASAIGWNYRYCCSLEHLEWKCFSILASQRSADGWELLSTFCLKNRIILVFPSPEHPYQNLLNPQCALRELLVFMETVLQPDPCTRWNEPGWEFYFTGNTCSDHLCCFANAVNLLSSSKYLTDEFLKASITAVLENAGFSRNL